MKKAYNFFIISRLYLKNFYKFLIQKTDINNAEDAFSLFMYSMKKIYSLDTFEYSLSIEKYGDECIKILKSTKGTPTDKDIRNISFEDRVRVVSVCEGYASAIGLLTAETINNSRMKEN